MRKIIFLIIVGLFTISKIFGQVRQEYKELIQEAQKLSQSKEYFQSGQKYSEAFQSLNDKGKINDRYDAACVWALANQPDSSFVHLFRITQNGIYTDLHHIINDPDLKILYHDSRWMQVVELVKSNKEKAEANLDRSLVAVLDTIYAEDQTPRMQIHDIEDKYGWESTEMQAHWKLIGEKDSVNLIRIKKILDTRGWLGADSIGKRGNETLFIVIQHADLETQEKYMPMMKDAVRKGNAKASSLALLEDRVALRKGEKQIYGSQIGRDQDTGNYYVLPLIDPDNVDKRRASVGLGTIQTYIDNWDMTWNVEEYKKRLAEYEKKM